jgi:hypothetical protein
MAICLVTTGRNLTFLVCSSNIWLAAVLIPYGGVAQVVRAKDS